MNKYEFFNNELAEMLSDNREARLILGYEEQIEHWTWMSECAKFRDAVDYGFIEDKDVVENGFITINLFPDWDEFDPRMYTMIAEYSTKAVHRKHRKSRRMAKVNRRKNSHWVAYLDGTSKECKTKNHRAVRREYDFPIGKSNHHKKIASREYFY